MDRTIKLNQSNR